MVRATRREHEQRAGMFDIGPVGPFIGTEGAFVLLQFAIVGTVIGLVYGRGAAATR